jgi:RimJ/RimL family protein N-acetyltransferase
MPNPNPTNAQMRGGDRVESIYLRALELDDLERTHKWHNDPALYEMLIGTFRYVSRVAEEEWLRRKVAYSTQEVNLAICLTSNSQHIGNFYLQNIDWIARHAEMGAFIGEPGLLSKGYGTEALRLMMRHAFQDLGLLKLYAHTLADNTAAIKHLEKCGYVLEGRLPRHCFKGGEFKDILIMAFYAGDLETA